jgi:hypothetical protein
MAGSPVILNSLLRKTAVVTTLAALAASIFTLSSASAAMASAPVTHQAQTDQISSIPTDIPSVRIVPGSVINLVSSESKVPVRIQNSFDSEIRVHVHMLPSNPRVTVPNAVEVIVPANSGINAQVPVKAIGNGKVFLIVWLTTFSGLRLTENAHLQMNVNAGIETAMLIVFGVLVFGLGTVGVLRTRRKLRKKAVLEAEGANATSGAGPKADLS